MYYSPLCEVLFFLMCNPIKHDSIIQMVIMYTSRQVVIMPPNLHSMLVKDMNPASFSAKLYMDYFSITW